jgi:hypothetical protein
MIVGISVRSTPVGEYHQLSLLLKFQDGKICDDTNLAGKIQKLSAL